MLVQIAGTSGSGKSHLMRSFLAWSEKKAGNPEVQYRAERKAPIGYLLPLNKVVGHNVFVPGHYDSPTGGCDTIHDIGQIYKLIESFSSQGCHVVFEGLFVMNMTRGPQLLEDQGVNFAVLQLTTPMATCIASINDRRAERGEGALENKKNTQDNYRRATNYCAAMRESGARVFKVSRDGALPKLLELLHA